MSDQQNKRKRKAYYRKCAAHSKRACLALEPDTTGSRTPKHLQQGLTGYLVTCNRNERLALMEVFRLLNDALKRSGSDGVTESNEVKPSNNNCPQTNTTTPVDGHDQNTLKGHIDDDDILKQLRMENSPSAAEMNTTDGKSYSFYSTRSGVSNCLFVVHYAKIMSPNALVHSIFENALRTQTVESRHVLRVLPVAATCHASVPELSRCVRFLWMAFLGRSVDSTNCEAVQEPVRDETTTNDADTDAVERALEQNSEKTDVQTANNFGCLNSVCPGVPLPRAQEKTLNGSKTFLVAFKARNYDRLSRDTAIDCTVSAVRDVDVSWRICPADPSVVIFVNVLRNVACISLLEDFSRFRKYNLSELLWTTKNKSSSLEDVPSKDK